MTARRVRHGKTLIEMLVVIVGMSAVLVTAGQMMHRLSRAERVVRESIIVARSEFRLARAFRADVRAAKSATLLNDEPTSGLRLTTADGSIEYAFQDGAVRRTADAGTAPQRDIYRLGSTTVKFSLEEDRFAVMMLAPLRQVGRLDAASGPLQIVAALGADVMKMHRDVPSSSPQPVEAPKPPSEEPR